MVQSRKVLIFVLIFVILFAIIPGQATKAISFEAGILFALIGIISVFGLLRAFSFSSISLNIAHWLFVLIFFFVAPISQATFGFSPWQISMDNQELVATNAVILLWSFFYLIGSRIGKKLKINRPKAISVVSPSSPSVILLLSCICALIVFSRVGFSRLLTQGEPGITGLSTKSSTAVSLILDKCTRATIVFAETLLILLVHKHPKAKPFLIMNTVVLLITCFPLSLSRNAVGTIYLGLLLVYFYKRGALSKKSPWFIIIFLFGTLIVFPILNAFRYYRIGNSNLLVELKRITLDLRDVYLSANYDAYAVITSIRDYVSGHGSTHGRQLLGSLLFFVPRRAWAAKPIGSGAMVATSRGLLFTNISCPLVAEGYVNFGVFGVVLFALFFGVVSAYLDRKFWEYSFDDERLSYIKMLYPFLPPSYFFMLRGDLMSSWAYTFAYVFVFFVLFNAMRFRISR